MGLPDSSRPLTIVIVGVKVAGSSCEREQQTGGANERTIAEIELDCRKDLDLFETMCKILSIPMQVKMKWARRRLMPWFRSNMTAWLYEYAKKHISKHGRVYSTYQLDIGAGAFKRDFLTHRNAVPTAVKRISRTSEGGFGEKRDVVPSQQLLQ